MKKIKTFLRSAVSLSICFMMAFTLTMSKPLTTFADAEGDANEDDTTIVTLGANLNQEERATVLSLLDLTEKDLEDCTVLEVTNQDEHTYLDDYLDASVIGTRALSSIKLSKAEAGDGIEVDTQNINYCTKEMYVNALATAGIEDADVVVVGPFAISGTAALVGVMKAYEEMTGEEIPEEVKDAATDELVTTGELSEVIGDKEKATELIGYIKKQVITQDLASDEEIAEVVKDAAEQMDITLTDAQVDDIVSMMKKISKLDIDPEKLQKQAQGIYDKIQELNIDTEKAKGFFDKIIEFFKAIYEKLVG